LRLSSPQLEDPDGWAWLDDPETRYTEGGSLIATGGGTSLEAEGSVAIRDRASRSTPPNRSQS